MAFYSILPLITFIVIYLVVSIVMGDFYKVPITVAFLVSSIVAIATLRGRSLQERMKVFSRGASSENMMLMIWIFILAGAFASSAKAMGSIDATVNLTLNLLPSHMIMAGIFVAACFISLSVGTSCGTIAALVPIATGLADETGLPVALLTAVVIGGSLFGDNLSFISDTTVVATQSQGCKMNEKFKANIRIVTPAAIITFIIYLIMGSGTSVSQATHDVNWLLVLPYIVVLITAISGINVMLVLTIGSLLTGIIGICTGGFDIFGWMKAMNEGILGMSELIIVTMLAGGMLEIVKENGGIKMIIKAITAHIHGRKGGELAIASLVTFVDFCTANNTVAIITIGSIAKQISEKFNIPAQRTASILDTFSCFAQGIIPYGAQMLIAAGLARLNPIEIIQYLYYPFTLGGVALIAILIYSRKNNETVETN